MNMSESIAVNGQELQRPLSTAEAARRLGVSQRTVTNLIARQRIVAWRIESVWRIDPQSLCDYLAQRSNCSVDKQ